MHFNEAGGDGCAGAALLGPARARISRSGQSWVPRSGQSWVLRSGTILRFLDVRSRLIRIYRLIKFLMANMKTCLFRKRKLVAGFYSESGEI